MIKLLLKHPFVRYVLSGLTAFAVEYVSFYVMFEQFKVMVLVANAFSFCLGLLVAFGLNRAWAFSAPDDYSKKATHQFGFYMTLAVINLFLTLGIVGVLRRFGVDPVIGKFIAMVITSSWNFLILKFWVFSHV